MNDEISLVINVVRLLLTVISVHSPPTEHEKQKKFFIRGSYHQLLNMSIESITVGETLNRKTVFGTFAPGLIPVISMSVHIKVCSKGFCGLH